MLKPLYSLSWLMGLLLAPHALVLLGNLAGSHQYVFFLWLALSAGLYCINARAIQSAGAGSQRSLPGGDRSILTILLLGGRALTTVALSTVLLVTAGFVFNETFVYWFPNFAFAFILLAIVLLANLWGSEAAQRLQLGATAVAVLGLVSLVVAGLWGRPGPGEVSADVASAAFSPKGAAAALLLFVGFDTAFGRYQSYNRMQMRAIRWGLLATALLLGLWAWVALLHVPPAKLSGSFIPHLLTARHVLGDPGRLIMGLVVIAGSVAAVNALFKSLAQLLSGLTSRHFGHSGNKLLKLFERPPVWHAIVAAAVGLMMAVGVAGTDAVDHYVRAGFILWICYYGGVNLSALTTDHGRSAPRLWQDRVFPLLGAGTMWLGAAVLVARLPNGVDLVKPFVLLAIVLVSMVVAGFFLKKRAVNYDMK